MADSMWNRLFSRRMMLKLSGTVSAAAGTGVAHVCTVFAAPGGQRWVYALDPDCGTEGKTCEHSSSTGEPGCSGCYACVAHAANKKWATPAAVRRAHGCCRCTLTKLQVSRADFEEMFGKGRNFRTEYDTRRALAG